MVSDRKPSGLAPLRAGCNSGDAKSGPFSEEIETPAAKGDPDAN